MSRLIKNEEMIFVTKEWGWEKWICNSNLYCGKILFIEKDKFCSFHKHVLKTEHLYLHSGKMKFNFLDENNISKSIIIEPGSAYLVEPGFLHQMHAMEDCLIFEFSTEHFDSDSYRATRDLVEENVKFNFQDVDF